MTLKEKLLKAKTSNTLFDSLTELDRKKNQVLAHISVLIQKHRKEKGMSQAELARTLKISQPAISKIESGDENVSIERLVEVFYALGYDMSIETHPRNCNEYKASTTLSANVVYVDWMQEWNTSGSEVLSN